MIRTGAWARPNAGILIRSRRFAPDSSCLRLARVSVALSDIQAVVFDLDDTLYPERSFAFSGFDAVADWLVARVPCPFDAGARMRELFDAGERGHVFDRLLAELGHPDAERMVPDMVTCYRTHAPRIRLFDDAEDALGRWGGICRLGLISDGPLAMQRAKVQALGLADRLDEIVLTDQWGRADWKPSPRAYRHIEEQFQVPASACVYLADNPGKDFVAPRRLGWRTVRVTRPGGIYADTPTAAGGEADATISTLRSLVVNGF